MFSETNRSSEQEYKQMELNPQYGDGEHHSPENVSSQMEEARAQAAYFEQQRQQWEEQRQGLEEANAQKALYLANLNQLGLTIHNAQRRIEQEMQSMNREYRELEQIHECFSKHLQVLTVLHPKTWSNEGLTERLRESLPKLDRAENDLNEAFFMGKKMRHTNIFDLKPGEEEKDGYSWAEIGLELLRGFFFHLPLFFFLLMSYIIWHFFIST